MLGRRGCQCTPHTCFDLVLHCEAAVVYKLLQGDRSVRDVQVQHAAHVCRMVEVQHLAVSVISLAHKFQKNLDQLEKELAGNGDALLSVVRQQVCNIPVWAVISKSRLHSSCGLIGFKWKETEVSRDVKLQKVKLCGI